MIIFCLILQLSLFRVGTLGATNTSDTDMLIFYANVENALLVLSCIVYSYPSPASWSDIFIRVQEILEIDLAINDVARGGT